MAGLDAGRSQTSHQNRRALLLTRETDTAEFEALAATLGIDIVETIFQRGKPEPRVHLGRGKIEEIAENWYNDVLSGHTTLARAQYLIDTLESNL